MSKEYINHVNRRIFTFFKTELLSHNKPKTRLNLFFCDRQDAELSAQQVIDHLKNTNKRISFDTVYKNLSLFVELGFLNCREDETTKTFSLNIVDSPVYY
ncbi:transcriptional repressor [Priestia flexa]|uniref:transcriptional repressor n=1 Tax=Priestia flexa TaxID=86664 RepID=UPI003D9431FF